MSVLHEMMVSTGLAAPDLARIIGSAPLRYKVYRIPKRNGGSRVIAQPSRELKILQRFFLERYLNKYPVHPMAMAYARGRNIYDNASYHAGGSVFLKLDFEGFFPSIKAGDWKKFLARDNTHPFDSREVELSTWILFWGDGAPVPKCLSIGAPTSPTISNILLFDFDRRITEMAQQHSVRYTRYADDITISAMSSDKVLAFEKSVRREVNRMRSPRLVFNEGKRGLYSKGNRTMVTGLVVTPVGQVSIGRDRKRLISVMIHKFLLGELTIDQKGVLKGLLGFTIANEPGFVERMRKKYGDDAVDRALRTFIPGRSPQKGGAA